MEIVRSVLMRFYDPVSGISGKIIQDPVYHRKNEYKRQLQTVHITESSLRRKTDLTGVRSEVYWFAFDRIENGAVNMDNIRFCKIEKRKFSGKVHIIVERMIQRGKYAIFNTGRPWYLGRIFAACIDQSGISDEN